jgi:hypothetical protein
MKTLLISLLFLISCETDNETISKHWSGYMTIGCKDIPIEFYLEQSCENLSGYFMSDLGSGVIELSESYIVSDQITLTVCDTAYRMNYKFSGVVLCGTIKGTYILAIDENIYTNNFEIVDSY